MGKPTVCIGENKDADQLRGNREADQRLCFRYSDSTLFLFYLTPKFQTSSSFLCLYRPVCVGPGRKPHCWFSHEAAQLSIAFTLLEEMLPNIESTKGNMFSAVSYLHTAIKALLAKTDLYSDYIQ